MDDIRVWKSLERLEVAVLVEVEDELPVVRERLAGPLERPSFPDGRTREIIGNDLDGRASDVDIGLSDDVDVVELGRQRVHGGLHDVFGVDREDANLYFAFPVDRSRRFVAHADDVCEDDPDERRSDKQYRRPQKKELEGVVPTDETEGQRRCEYRDRGENEHRDDPGQREAFCCHRTSIEGSELFSAATP